MAAKARIELPQKLIPVFQGKADVRGAYGGRGSAKTRSFAKMAAVWGYMFGKAGIKGIILCARQFMNSLADSSLEESKRAIENEPWLKDYYEIGDTYIRSLSRIGAGCLHAGAAARPVVYQAERPVMPTYEVTSPQMAKPWDVTAPEGATQEQVLRYAQSQWATRPKEAPAAIQAGGALKEIPRQLGLSARYAIEGPAQAAEIVTEPLRQLVTAPLARAFSRPGVSDIVKGTTRREERPCCPASPPAA